MSKSNVLEGGLLGLVFQAAGIDNLAENASSSPLTNLFVALHSADPGEAGTQDTNELSYTGYHRMTTSRSSNGSWTVSGNTASNSVTFTWSQCTDGTGVASHFSVGTSFSGAGRILYAGALTAALTISKGITPYASAGNLSVSED